MASVNLGSKAVGSVVKLNENGSPVEFYVAKHDYESVLNGAGRTLLVRKGGYAKGQWKSKVGENVVNTYNNSFVDSCLNGTYKNMLDDDIQLAMGTTRFYFTPGNGNDSLSTLERSIFLLSATELSHVHANLNIEGTNLSIASTLKICHMNGAAVAQWTRSPLKGNTGCVFVANTKGNFTYIQSSQTDYCYRSAFTLPANLSVNDDGTITTNTAPAVPSSITVPAQINGGSTVTISWGTATDGENNLEGYKVERSTDGGSTWAQIYQGGGTSTANIVPFGTQSVMYRVKAYDAEGLESAYRTSGQVAVTNNTAPTVPGGITVPEAVQGGQPLTVSWGASSDGENNLAGYSLERQVGGGDWAVVYSGDQLSFTDAIVKGWLSVAYRVRAFDTASAYSGFAVSETRQVNNNTPPAITCEHPANASLGTKSEGFELAYRVEDEEGDEVTVTELVDGAALRTFTAQLGAENHFTLGGLDFMGLLNGRHTLSISASDGASAAVHSLSFTKRVTAASVTLEQSMEADGPIAVCVLAVSGSIPADADFKVEVSNSANDETPVWEDCTAAVRAGMNHVFENETAANGFAFNFRLEVERGSSGLGGYITSVQGGFQ